MPIYARCSLMPARYRGFTRLSVTLGVAPSRIRGLESVTCGAHDSRIGENGGQEVGGQTFEQRVRGGCDDAHEPFPQRGVIHRLREIVALRRDAQIDLRQHVDLEELAPFALARIGTMTAVGADAAQPYFVQSAGLQPRTIASATATASRAAATS